MNKEKALELVAITLYPYDDHNRGLTKDISAIIEKIYADLPRKSTLKASAKEAIKEFGSVIRKLAKE